MASSRRYVLSLLIFIFSGVQSAIKDLNEDCAASDTCVHPTLAVICDTPSTRASGKCRVQVGQACNDTGGLCVNGATCDSDFCTCGLGYNKAADNKCSAPKGGWGLACAFKTVCSLPGLTCSTGVCVCEASTNGYVLPNGTCTAIAPSKVGFACTGATTASTCGDPTSTHLTCNSTDASTGVCKCVPGYYPLKTGDVCVANTNSKIGVPCTSGGRQCGDPTTTFLECPTGSSKCACKSNYTGIPGGVCFPSKGTLAGGCANDADCATGQACTQVTQSGPKTCKTVVGFGDDCSNNSTTACKTGMTCPSRKCVVSEHYNGGSCMTNIAFTPGSCTTNRHTVCGATQSGICMCEKGYSGEPASDCAVIATMFGGKCKTTTANTKGDCYDDSLVCSAASTGTCVCAVGYGGGLPGLTCYAIGTLGGPCSASSPCADPNSLCTPPPSLCKCKRDYVAFHGECALKAGVLSDKLSCSGKTCVGGSTCLNSTNPICACNTGYTESAGYCLAPNNLYGGPCYVSASKPPPLGTCIDTNTTCVGGLCVCRDPYTGVLGDTCRLISGAGTVTVPISLLMLQLAACVWKVFHA